MAASQPAVVWEEARWEGWFAADLVDAGRLGAAVALVQDYLCAVRDGKGVSAFVKNEQVKSPPAGLKSWSLLMQVSESGESHGLYPLELDLRRADLAGVDFGVRIVLTNKTSSGLQLLLTRDSSLEGYLGWRIETAELVDKPRQPVAIKKKAS